MPRYNQAPATELSLTPTMGTLDTEAKEAIGVVFEQLVPALTVPTLSAATGRQVRTGTSST